jgi:hypothetical protein
MEKLTEHEMHMITDLIQKRIRVLKMGETNEGARASERAMCTIEKQEFESLLKKLYLIASKLYP